MWNKKFEGWYYKHQLRGDVIAFIPGRAESGGFIQMIYPDGSRRFDMPEPSVRGDAIRVGGCLFSPRGCKIDLPGVSGEILYGENTPLRSDVMGPFRFVPMECRHGVVSMAHTLSGGLTVDGAYHGFDGGVGYIEKDSGTSFPSSYQWLQCNDFVEPCSLMASVANIPFLGSSFTGFICAVIWGGREYRFATYNGARILAADEGHIRLSRKRLLLEIDIAPSRSAHPLQAPVRGRMTGTIRESTDAEIDMRLWEGGRRVCELHSGRAAYEYVR